MRILVVEDNFFYRRMLEATLTEWGYVVCSTGDGEEAWQILKDKNAPKLALLDWEIPGADGLELCRRVRTLAREEPTYIILLTAKGGKENIISGLEGGADDYMCKPFDREELHARLRVGVRIVGLNANLAARVRELEEALSGAQKLEAVGRLAGGVAHDFNNLLTIILGYSEALLAELPQQDGRYEMVTEVHKAGERAAGLTRQLLAFSRKQVLAPVVLDLNALVADLGKMLKRLIGEDIQMVLSCDPQLYAIRADPGQLEQVLLNLAVNARDAMPEGGQVTITTRNVDIEEDCGRKNSPVPPGSYVLLAVSDTGCGMDEQTKARIFEPFFTTKEMGKGTGLGLATVYGIVKQSNGAIQVESAPGAGTTFRVYLPRCEQTVAASQVLPTARVGLGDQETVLLVEDEDQVRSMARRILQMHNYNVLEANCGNTALQLAEQWPGAIHLLLTDVVMPKLSGRQLADQLVPLRPEMQVLYMSGYADGAVVRDGILESGVPFLQKPFTAAGLAEKVRKVLDSKAVLQAVSRATEPIPRNGHGEP